MSSEKKSTPNQERALSLDKHISLTANAGSGKTAVLVDRYLKIAIEQKTELSKIVAITFTEKAASELYAKISQRIEDLAENELTASKKQEYYNLRRKLFTAKISTIHSFCIDILREFSVEANIDANFSVADTAYSNELIELSLEEVKRKYVSENLDTFKSLIRPFGSWKTLQGVLIEMLNKRETILSLFETVYHMNEKEIEEHFNNKTKEVTSEIISIYKREFINVLRRINAGEKKQSKKESTVDYIKEILTYPLFDPDTYNATQNRDFLRVYIDACNKVLTKSGTIRSNYLKEFTEEKQISESDEVILNKYRNLCEKLIYEESDLAKHKELAIINKKLIGIFEVFNSVYERKKKEKGILDFEDFLIKVYDITKIPQVCEQLREKYSYIMIDEYQDTNDIQYKIFLPIVNNLLDNNLFVVGDEKQSIYRFRNAELEVFRKTKEEIEKVTGKEAIQQLPESFRMSPPLAFFTNLIFNVLFADPRNIFNEVANTPIIAAKQFDLEGRVEFILVRDNKADKSETPTNKTNEEDNPETNTLNIVDSGIKQIQIVAKKIKSLISETESKSNQEDEKESLKWEDIAVLCRKRKSFINIEKIFSDEGIPYTILGGQGFYQRQMIYDINNYISFLVNNKDDAALTGILRSPFFMLSDTTIYDISLTKEEDFKNYRESDNTTTSKTAQLSLWEKLTIFEKSSTGYDEASEQQISSIVKTLSENIRIANKVDIILLIRKIVEEGNYLTIISARKQGKTELKNLEKLLRKTRDFVKKGFKTLYDYKVFLSEAISKEMEEGIATESEDSNSVNVMTIHKAKGLQYKAVFVVDLQDVPRSSTTKKKEIKIERNIGIITKLPEGGNYFEDYCESPIQRVYDYIDERKNIAEAKRLFYVALTRAENYLYLSAVIKNSKPRTGSFLEFLRDGIYSYSDSRFLDSPQLSKRELEIKGTLKRAIRDDDKYKTIEEEVCLKIPVTNDIEPVENETSTKAEIEERESEDIQYRINVDKIATLPSEEIYSATKISSFLQCPLKYHLTFNLGYQQFITMKGNITDGDFEGKYNEYSFNDEEERKKYSDEETDRLKKTLSALKGKIIHSILEKEITEENLGMFIENRLKMETEFYLYDKLPIENLRNAIINEVKGLYKSKIFTCFENYKKYRNEYKLMVYDNDYILFGILDRIIFTENKIIIVDYKTDNIDPNDNKIVLEKGLEYLNQLKFYAYLVFRKYQVEKVELRIVFVKYPDVELTETIKQDEIIVFGKLIEEAVFSIRNYKFTKKLEHCKKCIYSVNKNSCIIT